MIVLMEMIETSKFGKFDDRIDLKPRGGGSTFTGPQRKLFLRATTKQISAAIVHDALGESAFGETKMKILADVEFGDVRRSLLVLEVGQIPKFVLTAHEHNAEFGGQSVSTF